MLQRVKVPQYAFLEILISKYLLAILENEQYSENFDIDEA